MLCNYYEDYSVPAAYSSEEMIYYFAIPFCVILLGVFGLAELMAPPMVLVAASCCCPP